jgi:hypothetical protein
MKAENKHEFYVTFSFVSLLLATARCKFRKVQCRILFLGTPGVRGAKRKDADEKTTARSYLRVWPSNNTYAAATAKLHYSSPKHAATQ